MRWLLNRPCRWCSAGAAWLVLVCSGVLACCAGAGLQWSVGMFCRAFTGLPWSVGILCCAGAGLP